MENYTIKVMLEKLQSLKEQHEIEQAIHVAHDVETILLKMPESKRLLQCYLELFHLYYMKGDLRKAFNYFTLSQPLLLEYGEWEQYTIFMQNVVKTTFFYVRKAEIENFVENLIPLAFEQEQYEVLSHCLLTQSYIHLYEGEQELAIQEAKMAYFYAQFVEEDMQYFVLCNAQLQLVLILIEKIAIDKAQFYIDQFGWKIDGCQNNGEKILVTLVQSMVNLLNHKFEETIPIVENALSSLKDSSEIMYSTILTRQIQLVIRKVKKHLTIEQFNKLNELCNEIKARFKMSQATFMNEYETFSKTLIDKYEPKFEQSVNIFYLGQKVFEEAIETNSNLYCKVFKMNYETLSEHEKQMFKQQLIEEQLFDEQSQLIISQFSRDLLLLIAILQKDGLEQSKVSIEAYNDNESTHLLYDPTTKVFSNFHQLFNYVFFNQLLEIDIDPFKQSLA